MKITKLSINRPTLVVVLFVTLAFLGIASYSFLNYELAPKITPPVLTVMTIYPGASPSEVENSVSRKIEDAVSMIENLDEIHTVSQENLSFIRISLNSDADVDLGLQEAQRKINGILRDLPVNCEQPTVDKFDIEAFPIIRMGVFSTMTETEFHDLAKERVQPAFAQLKGVARVNILGGTEREICVNIDADKLENYGLSILQVNEVIKLSNLDFPTGNIKSNDGQSMIRLSGKLISIVQMGELVVGEGQYGVPVRLKDIADIVDSGKENSIINRTNCKSSIGIDIQKQADANTVEVSELVKKKIEELELTYETNGLDFEIAQNTADFTLEAANAVMSDLLLAVILVSLVMLLFLHSIRNSIFVIVAIPVSLISTFIAMYLFNFSLNLLTLLALSLVVGTLVDDAIVVIENIYRHMEMGKNRVQASFDALKEIGMTVASITLVLVVVFFPITLTTGIVSDLLRQFCVVVVVATLFSLLVSFTLVPLLTSRFAKLEVIKTKSLVGRFVNGFELMLDRFVERILSMLKWAFRYKIAVVSIAFLMLVGSIALIPAGFIGTEFLSFGDRGEFILQLEMPQNSTLEQTNFITRDVEKYLQEQPEVTSIFTTVGTKSGTLSSQSTAYYSELSIKLVPKKQRDLNTDMLARKMKTELEESTVGGRFSAVSLNILGMVTTPIEIIITDPDIKSLKSYSQKVKNNIAGIDGVLDVKSSVEGISPELSIDVDRDKLALNGLTLGEVGAGMQLAFSGSTKNKFRSNNSQYDIRLQFDKFDRKSRVDIENMSFVNRNGQVVQLKQFAEVTESVGAAKLERYNRMASVTITAQVIGRSTGAVGDEIKDSLNKLTKPEETQIIYAGDMKHMTDAFGSLIFALIASIVFVYLIMVALYNSYIYPFVVLFSIPLAVIGALLALALANQNLNIFSIMGIIMLVGLVAKNAILVVDFANQLQAAGRNLKEALLEATRLRFRPIAMTNFSMIVGMFPLAFASGAGADWKNGLAWVLIGGLTSSMFLSLIIVPVIYYVMDRAIEKFGYRKKEKIVVKDSPTLVKPLTVGI